MRARSCSACAARGRLDADRCRRIELLGERLARERRSPQAGAMQRNRVFHTAPPSDAVLAHLIVDAIGG
jgi:hypothetical protein